MPAPVEDKLVRATVRQKDPGWLKRLLGRYDKGPVLAVGVPVGSSGASQRYPDGTSLLMVAAVQQFGSISRGIPQRDYMGPGGTLAVERTAPIVAKGVQDINAGKATKEQVLRKMGPFAQGAVQDTIANFTTPGNAQSTIDRKGDDNPLEDTGALRNAMTWVVRGNK
jgi:hypothetical protein